MEISTENRLALGQRRLHNLARSLERDQPGAVDSVREEHEQTLAVVRLGLTGALQRTLRSTNAIEISNTSVKRYTQDVKRSRGDEMIQRWVGAALLDADRRLRRLRGYRDPPKLILGSNERSTNLYQSDKAA